MHTFYSQTNGNSSTVSDQLSMIHVRTVCDFRQVLVLLCSDQDSRREADTLCDTTDSCVSIKKNKQKKRNSCEFPTKDLGLGALQGAAVNLAGKPGGAQSGIPCKKNEKNKKKKRKCNVVSTSATSSPPEVSAKKSVKQLSVSPYRERKERSSPPASCHIFIAVLGRSDGPHLHAQCGLPAAGEETGETC